MNKPKPNCYKITAWQDRPSFVVATLQYSSDDSIGFINLKTRNFTHRKNAYNNAVSWAQREIKRATGIPTA